MELIDLANSFYLKWSNWWLTFLLGSLAVTRTGFFSSDASICSTMSFPPLEHSGRMLLSQFPLTSNKLKTECSVSSHSLWLFSCWVGRSSWSLEDILKLSASAAAIEFCEWLQVRIDVYIPHRKYQVKLHSYPWFSASRLCCCHSSEKSLFSFVPTE